MKRKILALLLVLTVVICLLPASALAAAEAKTAKAETTEPAEIPEKDVTAEAADAEGESDAADVEEEELPVPPQTDPTPEEIAAAAALADLIQPDGALDHTVLSGTSPYAVVVTKNNAASIASDAVTVSEGETAYAYEGMTVFNNGGTVYANLATVFNNGGTVYNNGGLVYNNAGVVYANVGTVYNNAGEVYNNDAEIFSFSEDDIVSSSRIYPYYELKFADYYEPFVLVDGVTTEPGSEKMIISENAVCHISPYPGFVIRDAKTDAGDFVWAEEDGSLYLSNVDADTILTLTLQADVPVFNLESGSYASEQTVSLSGPAGCKIYYSLDGSVPDAETGILYEEAFPVSESCVITAVSVVDGVETSDTATLKLAFLSFASPVFAEEKEGYFRPSAQAIVVKNPGTEEVIIVSVSLEGENAEAFALSTDTGKAVPAGGVNDTKWTIRPVKGLSAGVYEAVAVFSLDSGETVEVPLLFTVISDGSDADAEATETETEAVDGEEPAVSEDEVLPEEEVPEEQNA